MSDENTTRTDAASTETASTGTSGASATMPPTPPIGSESVEAGDTTSTSASSGEATAAPTGPGGPAGPGEERYAGDREAVDSVGATSESPVGRIAGAAADAAKQAGAKLKEAAQQADLDEFADQAKRVTNDWSARIKEEYQRRPGVVIGAAVGAVVLLGAIARGLGRRR